MAAYEAIATNEVMGAYVQTLTWSSIPQTYEHLVLRGSLRKGGISQQNSGIDLAMKMEFNNNTASTWAEAYHGSSGGGGGARAVNTLGYVRNLTANGTRYPHFMYVEIVIGGYSRTDNAKSALYRTWGGTKESSTSGTVGMIIGCLCEDPDGGTLAAISEIDLTCVGSSNPDYQFGAGSIMTLYGLNSS